MCYHNCIADFRSLSKYNFLLCAALYSSNNDSLIYAFQKCSYICYRLNNLDLLDLLVLTNYYLRNY